MNLRGRNATQARRSYKLAGDIGLAMTMLAPQSRADLTIEVLVSPLTTRIGSVRHGLLWSWRIDRMKARPPPLGRFGSTIIRSIFCSLRTCIASRLLRTSTTRLAPKPRRMLWIIAVECGLGSANRNDKPAILIFGLRVASTAHPASL